MSEEQRWVLGEHDRVHEDGTVTHHPETLIEPDHHADRRPFRRREEVGSVPHFEVERAYSSTSAALSGKTPIARVRCTRCDGRIFVTWADLDGHAGETRPCFHCFRVSRIPGETDD